MEERKAIVQLKNITKSFGDNQVLKPISLDIYEGEFLTLLGSSGCGKTTTLRIIAGFETPTEGNVYIEDKESWHRTTGMLTRCFRVTLFSLT